VASSCEHGNELPGSVKGGKFLQCILKDSVPRSWLVSQVNGVCGVQVNAYRAGGDKIRFYY